MLNIQSATAEIRQGKKEEEDRKKKPQDKNIISASATPGGHIDRNLIGFDLSVIQQAHIIRGMPICEMCMQNIS